MLFALPSDVLSLVLGRLEIIDRQCLRLSCKTARDLVDYHWKPLRGHESTMVLPINEDHVQRARYALCRGLSPDLVVGHLVLKSTKDLALEILQGELHPFKRLRLTFPAHVDDDDYYPKLGRLLNQFKDVAELEFIVGNIDMFSLLLDELPALWASVRTISIESQEVTRDCTDADTADGGREDWEDWAPPEGEFWESLAQFTALTNLALIKMDAAHDWPLERLPTLRELRIEGEGSVIPDGTWKLPELTCLMLDWVLTPLPDNIEATSKLRTLALSCDDGHCLWPPPEYQLPVNLSGLRELRRLFCGAHLESIPDGFSQLAGLTSLELTAVTTGGVLSAHFGRLTNLQNLTLHHVYDPIDVSILGSLVSLQELDLEFVDLDSLDFSQLTRLTKMALQECSDGLHPSIGQLCNLEYLYLWQVEQLVLPDQFSCLSALTHLHITPRCIGKRFHLPPAIGGLSSLRQLVLDTAEIPHEFGQLQQLQHLQLHTRATSLPQSMTNLSQLTSLDISLRSPITSIPALGKLPRIRKLKVRVYGSDDGHGSGFPWYDFLSNSTSLTSLTLHGSYPSFFEPLPPLPNLRKLELSLYENDEALPEAVTRLSQLTSLVLSLDDVPIPIPLFGLSSLRALRIDRSPACKLPTGISKLQNLMYLSLPKEVQLCRSVTKLKRLVRIDATVAGDEEHFETLTRLARAGVTRHAQRSCYEQPLD